MKNKNTILLEVSTHTVASVFSRFYHKENRFDGLDISAIPTLIEDECVKQARLCFNDEKDNLSDRDIFLLKMHAVSYYEQYFSKILEERLKCH